MSTEPLIEIRGLERSVAAARDPLISVDAITIAAGDRIGLRGETGSGKSTLLRAIALLDPWQSGELRYRNRLVPSVEIPGYRRNVVYLPQRPAMVAGTVRENLQLPYRFAITSDRFSVDRAIELLAPLGKSASFLDQPADLLSGGERQLVALVRALQFDPQVLLLDEPTASLDSEMTEQLEHSIERWMERGDARSERALVIASHLHDQLARMANRIWRIDARRLLEERLDG